MPPVKVSKDQDYCGETLPNETYLIDAVGGLSNVVVFIETPPTIMAALDKQRENMLNNTGCRYVPRIMAMQKGERLKVKNDDPKLHIPHSYHEDRTVFNLSLPFKGLPQGLDNRASSKSSAIPMHGCWHIFMSSIILTIT
jgi:hypothetical protein